MDANSSNNGSTPSRLSTRRPTLERQSSVEAGNVHEEGTSGSSEHTSRSPNVDQSSEKNLDPPPLTQSQSFDSQILPLSSSMDKSPGGLPMSKAGRKRKHPVKPGKHICPYCSRPCAKPSVLEKHIRMHTGERPYPCDACDLSFKTKSNLYKHRKSFTHMQKCKEKGLSMESSYGESFGSSRDESVDIEGDEDNQLPHIGYRRASSMGGSIDLSRKNTQSPYSMRQPSYMETLQHLEQVYDVIDSYAKKMGTVVSKHAHWLIDKDCIVSVQLQHPPPPPAVNGSSVATPADKPKVADAVPSSVSSSSNDVELRISNLLKANAEIVRSASTDMPKRRLSRQQSVSSPAIQMFNSSTSTSSSPSLPTQYACSGIPEVGHKLPDGEELLRQIRQVIHLNTNIDSNIKLLMHKHCMEVKMRLFVPDLAARRRFGQGLLASLSEQKQQQGWETGDTHQRFTCSSCGQGFNREHILEIHTAFYCHAQLSALDNLSSMRAATGQSFDEGMATENKRMRLLKTGSEEYTYIIADDKCNSNRLTRLEKKLPSMDRVSPHRSPSVQQPSTEAGPEPDTTLQQLKKHVLKHMSQGSIGADTADGVTAVSSSDGNNQEMADSTAIPVTDALLPTVIVDDVDLPATQADAKPSASHPLPTYTNLTTVRLPPQSTSAELAGINPPPRSPLQPTTWGFTSPVSRRPIMMNTMSAVTSPASRKGEATPSASSAASVTTGIRPVSVQETVSCTVTQTKPAKVTNCPPAPVEGVTLSSPATMIHIAPANTAVTASLAANAGSNAVQHVASPLLGSKPMLLAAPQAWRGVPSIALVAPSGSPSISGASPLIITPLPALVSSPRILPRRSSVKPILPAEPTAPGVQLLAPKSDKPPLHPQPHSVFHFAGPSKGSQPIKSETERVSALRRRFSQSRSKSSVSFEEPLVKQPTTLSSPTLNGSFVGTAHTPTIVLNTSAKPINAAEPQTTSSIAPTTSPVSRAVGLGQVTTNSVLSPRQPHSYSSNSLATIETSTIQGAQQKTMCRSSKNVDCHLCYCTTRCRRIPCESRAAASKYLNWSPSKPPVSVSPFIDMSVPLSFYRSKQNLSVVSYTNSSVEARHIYTHSSYWQYKNKRRVMHSMPSMSISSTLPASEASQDTAVSKATTSSTSETGITIVVSTCAPVSAETSPVCCTNSNTLRPSVITRDYQSKKKLLHRSQSTPNAGEETQSKLIAGGFKSDEDYVYIRGRGKGKFVCQQCGIRCRKPSMLKKHIRTHTDLRPYSCKHCNFSFKTKGNLTKHMRSKAHHRRCLELHIVPVPLTVDDSQIDMEVLASQQKLSRESKIKGAKLTEEDEDMEGSESEDHSSDDEDEEESDDSSVDDALHIDESSDDASQLNLPSTSAEPSLRRVQSMPAHHMANSFDATSLADMLPDEPKPVQSLEPMQPLQPLPPPKKRKRNHLNLTISTASARDSPPAHANSSNIEDDIAMSLLDLSKTPVHGTPTTVKESSLPVQHVQALQTPKSVDAQRVSVVRSTKSMEADNSIIQDEPIDLRVQTKSSQLKFICPLCRAICSNQELLNAHMKLHDGPVIEVANKSTKKQMSKNKSLGSSMDVDGVKPTPQTPNTLKRQHAISAFDSDADDELDVDSFTKVEPRDMINEKLMKRKCPYCPKVFHNDSSLPQHIKVHHLITQEYVCTYKDCGNKFTNKQDLTYHLGTHALDDNDKYQPISIPKCGICEKTFKSMSSLKQHLQHHSEARPHVCEYCDAGFTTAQSLKHHLKTHTQERPYVCGECGSTFARSDHLTQHTKIHKKHTDCGSRGGPQPPTILNAAGAESHSHHN